MIQGQLIYYSYHWITIGNPPNWFINPFNGQIWPDTRKHWSGIDDFNSGVGDIKNVWEASRFEWVVTLARAYAVSGKMIYLDTLNRWLNDWMEKNPVNTGPNWKCGQEASIRVFNLINAGLILKQWDRPSLGLKEFIYEHLERINSNIRYAIAQDNNHGTSEAAALFIGGHWAAKTLTQQPLKMRCGYFASRGRKWLENRIEKLIEEDGSFSQHSVTYHRVLLDTLTFAEYWRKELDASPFSTTFYQRTEAAIHWLFMLTDIQSGNAPNFGSNDGAMFLHNHVCDYRDFRPSIQTASILFSGKKCFGNGPWDEGGYWLGLNGEKSDNIGCKRTSEVFPGGYVVMFGKESWGMLRFPMYRFRPAHNDVFHFDLWHRGINICRDAGSYSYNPGDEFNAAYFQSVRAHNTVCFDDGEQMPRLSRFLIGRWIKADYVGSIEKDNDGRQYWTGAYRDYRGNHHQRKISWKENDWLIEDSLSGVFKNAEIIYRLPPEAYRIEGNKVFASWGKIEISGAACDINISTGFESLYYHQKQVVSALVLRIGNKDKKIMTRFLFET